MNRLAIISIVLIAVGLAAFVIPRVVTGPDRQTLEPGPTIEEPGSATWYIDVPAGAAVAAGIVVGIFSFTRGPDGRRKGD